jgi:hypothetical protein
MVMRVNMKGDEYSLLEGNLARTSKIYNVPIFRGIWV